MLGITTTSTTGPFPVFFVDKGLTFRGQEAQEKKEKTLVRRLMCWHSSWHSEEGGEMRFHIHANEIDYFGSSQM